MTTYTVRWKMPSAKAGDTIKPFKTSAIKDSNGQPIIPDRVCATLRDFKGVEVYKYNASVNPLNGCVSIGGIPPEDSINLQSGEYLFGLKYIMTDGSARTYLEGRMSISKASAGC